MADATAALPSQTQVRWPRQFLLAGRLILGAVFVYAAYTKIRSPWMLFAMSINSYQILPEWAVTYVARTLPWFEMALGLLLLTGLKVRWTASTAAGLLIFFFAAMVRAYFKNMGIDCGCFGFGERLGPLTLARDASLLVLAITLATVAFILPRRQP
jgi:uncharacterized membrane protein YphA (DoxX/SURF4 family)